MSGIKEAFLNFLGGTDVDGDDEILMEIWNLISLFGPHVY